MFRFVKILLFSLFIIVFHLTMFSQIPESKRSKEVIKSQYPLLEKSFKEKGLTFGSDVFIRIFKDKKELEVWILKDKTFNLYNTYKICTFSGGLGPKKKTGDCKSPEGFYYATPKSLNPSSTFHLSFNTNYPNAFDRSNNYTGSALMIHGDCVSIGCYAMTDDYIEEIYSILQKAFENGQKIVKIHIFPFKITDKNLSDHKDSEYYSFWSNLKEGYEYFEDNKTVPEIIVTNKKYAIKK